MSHGLTNQTINQITGIRWTAISFQIILMLIAVLDNSIVIIAILKDKNLRSNLTYRFLVSLAVADLLMGSIVMPQAILYTLNMSYWPFGQLFCDLWRATDVLSSTASILNLCAISVERYWAIENPITYASLGTMKKCSIMLIAVWSASILISYPAIFWWAYLREDDYHSASRCDFTTNRLYLISSSMVSFYLPLIVMIVTYTKIYRTASFVIKSMKNGSIIIDKVKLSNDVYSRTILRVHCGRPKSNLNYEKKVNPGYLKEKNIDRSKILSKLYQKTSSKIKNRNSITTTSNNLRTIKFYRERKAAKTLGIIMGLLIACWLPFFICNISVAINSSFAQDYELVMEIVTWLGYFNSILNPIIYARSMRELRREFINLLLCRKICNKSTGHQITYVSQQNFRFSIVDNHMAKVKNSPLCTTTVDKLDKMQHVDKAFYMFNKNKKTKFIPNNKSDDVACPSLGNVSHQDNNNITPKAICSQTDNFGILYNYHTFPT